MRAAFRTHWPLGAIVLILAAVMGVTLTIIYAYNQGRFVYVLDDAYIHMAVAKHFSQDGVWGITRYAFTSLSSSPLWTLLLSGAFWIAGPRELIPLWLNLAAVLAVLWIFHSQLLRLGLGGAKRFLLLGAFLFLVPIPAMVLTGQEHVLHIGLILVLAWAAVEDLARSPREADTGIPWAVCGLSFLAVTARYESAFLVFGIGLLFFLRREFRKGILAGLSGGLPILVYGLISVAHGWSWLPNSLLLKGQRPDLHSLQGAAGSLGLSSCQQLMDNPHLLFPVIGAFLYWILTSRRTSFYESRGQMLAALFLLATLLHLQFARTGWFFRYEAYLMALALLTLAAALPDLLEAWRSGPRLSRTVMGVLLALACLPLVQRGGKALMTTPAASRNIFEQQIQMASFFHTYYEGQCVAANDIGAINFFADLQCLDLWGLASRDVMRLKLGGSYTPEAMAALADAHHVRVAVVYDSWFRRFGGLPPAWTQAGAWKIRDNVICGSDTVSFYAVVPAETEPLMQHLREFAPRLPGRNLQNGPYIP
jgi:hypothetical protein